MPIRCLLFVEFNHLGVFEMPADFRKLPAFCSGEFTLRGFSKSRFVVDDKASYGDQIIIAIVKDNGTSQHFSRSSVEELNREARRIV